MRVGAEARERERERERERARGGARNRAAASCFLLESRRTASVFSSMFSI